MRRTWRVFPVGLQRSDLLSTLRARGHHGSRSFAVYSEGASTTASLIDSLETTMKVNAGNALLLVSSTAALILVAGTACLIISRPAEATAQFATQTGKACGDCHESATGGGKLTPFGEAFKANGNKLP